MGLISMEVIRILEEYRGGWGRWDLNPGFPGGGNTLRVTPL